MSQVWLITGSSRGLGRAFTEAVLAARHRVLAAARNPDQLADLHAGVVKRFIAPLSMSPVAVKRGTATSEAILKRYNSDNVAIRRTKRLPKSGKLKKTLLLCDCLVSREVQPEVHEGLNVVENWNATKDFSAVAVGAN